MRLAKLRVRIAAEHYLGKGPDIFDKGDRDRHLKMAVPEPAWLGFTLREGTHDIGADLLWFKWSLKFCDARLLRRLRLPGISIIYCSLATRIS